MKPSSKSRTDRAGAGVIAIGAFLAAIQAAPAGIFPAWVIVLAGAGVAALGAYILALRAEDRRNAPTIDRPKRDREKGFAQVDQLISLALMAIVVLGIAVALFSSGCSATWPKQCELQDHIQRCKCQRLAGVDHSRSKTYTWECDGQQLPIVAEYGSVRISEPATEVAP